MAKRRIFALSGGKMNLKFQKAQLVNALSIVMKAVSTKTSSVILESILISASDNRVVLDATDTELSIQTEVDAVIVKAGGVVLNAKLFSEIVRKFDSTESLIELDVDNDFKTTIKCEQAVFNIMGIDPVEFIPMPKIDRDAFISLSQFSLKEVIRQTEFSTAISDINRMMGGELIDVKNNVAKFVTLDGHRMSIRNIELMGEYEDQKCVVPIKSLQEVMRIIDSDTQKNVNIYFSKDHILFEFDKTLVLSRILDGEFFRIESMLSNDYDTKVNVSRLKLQNAIEQSMILIRENEHKPMILDIENGMLKLSVNSSLGFMDAKVNIEKSGSDLKIAFNPKFLVDALKVIDDDFVNIYFTNAKSPCFIRDDKNTYTYLILPVNFIV
ncbi:DNA polymerase III, beta subunit [Lachnoanaerobaculum saburreum]|uniref:Beta sliding clamp n=2 Tax=Lachnoanaerobaculum saburreum TaxID=467210 RepID=A0A133ZF70_9FIRM|nr:DNA polymerase III, beta subunit [Lachnoanaerobaculum saburreum]